MEITYCGHACFKLKAKDGMVIYFDPFKADMVGLPLAKDVADILIISHQHEDHNAAQVITGPVKREKTFVIDKEGEYEIAGIQISTMHTYHDKNSGAERGKNLVTAIVMDSLHVVHLGDLGHKLSESQVEKLGSVDVLMVPVGGYYTLDMEEVEEVIKEIQPSYVIPMHYRVAGGKIEELATLESFLEKNKLPVVGEAVHKIKIEESSLPDDTQILLMNA